MGEEKEVEFWESFERTNAHIKLVSESERKQTTQAIEQGQH
jgi:hypothetical protein